MMWKSTLIDMASNEESIQYLAQLHEIKCSMAALKSIIHICHVQLKYLVLSRKTHAG